MKKLILTTTVLFSCALAFGQKLDTATCKKPDSSTNIESTANKVVPVAEFIDLLMDSTVQVIDVRSAAEFKEQHIKGAINIDMAAQGAAQKISALDKDKKVLIYCYTGGRSAKAGIALEKVGFKDIRQLKGGLKEWIAINGPLVKQGSKE